MNVTRRSRRRPTWMETATKKASDPKWRRSVTENATQIAGELASEVAERATTLGGQVTERAAEMAHEIAEKTDEKRTHLFGRMTRSRPRHTLRKVLAGVGLGAAAAYFLDREKGAERRARTRRRSSSSARHMGSGLETAAKVANKTADFVAVDERPLESPIAAQRGSSADDRTPSRTP